MSDLPITASRRGAVASRLGGVLKAVRCYTSAAPAAGDTFRPRDRLGGHRRHACGHGRPRPRARADPGQSHRARLRRHPIVGFAPRRRSRQACEELRATLPIGRVVGPVDVAALAVHLVINTAVTSATYNIGGGQQFVA
jgi:hypothetical protein